MVACLHFWGLTIDVVTSVNLIVAIGLAVDYSAHIAHSFMVEQGTRHGTYLVICIYQLMMLNGYIVTSIYYYRENRANN